MRRNKIKCENHIMKKAFLRGAACFFLTILLFGAAGCGTKETVLLGTDDIVSIKENNNVTVNEMEQTEKSVLYIHICGAVKNPGVYELDSGSRIYDAVEAAGGFNENASMDYVNLAMVLEDGLKITIPTKEETEIMSTIGGEMQSYEAAGEGGGDKKSGKVNLNTASKAELLTLTGVGESRAEAIMAYRDKNGSFSQIEDIMKVEGIKEGMFEKLKDSICVK